MIALSPLIPLLASRLRLRLGFSVTALLAPPMSIAAAEAEATAPGVPTAALFQTVVVLALILVLFVGAAWLMRRLNGGRGLLAENGPMRVLAALSVGPRERILLVEIEDTWLVVGSSPGHMRTLHTLPKGSLPPPAAGHNPFGQWLRHFQERKRHGGN